MKCPTCDTTNGRTNKYCRACGTRLEVLASHNSEPEEPRVDDVALGEALFRVHELFESGEIDSALEQGEEIAEANPGSSSAHAIVALAYERKAEHELADGDAQLAHEYLRKAIDRYEKILDLNPDSAADRGKLVALRLRYSGQPLAEPAKVVRPRLDFVEAFHSIPRPVLAAFGAFLVLLAAVIIFTGPRGSRRDERAQHMNPTQKSLVTVTQTPTATAPELKVYTFPQSTTTPTPPTPTTMEIPKIPTKVPAVSFSEVRPMKVPKIDQEITLVPEPKAAPKKPVTEPAKQPEKGIDLKAAPVSSGPSGSTLLAHAIRLRDQGKVSEAISTANEAIAAWNADIQAGAGVDAARRGIANANKFIAVWQSSTSD